MTDFSAASKRLILNNPTHVTQCGVAKMPTSQRLGTHSQPNMEKNQSFFTLERITYVSLNIIFK